MQNPISFQSMPIEEMWPLIADVFEKNGQFRLYPRGKSMLPLIREGVDSVLLEAPASYAPRDLLLYRRDDGRFVLHRLIRITEEGLVMCGDNQFYLEKYIKPTAVLARVCGIYRGDSFFKIDTPKLRRYGRRRIWSRPFRHFLYLCARRLSKSHH